MFQKINKQQLLNAQIAIKFAQKCLLDWHREHFIGIYLDSRGRVINAELISLGTLTASLVHPREIFSPAFKKQACGIFLLHTHPSGEPWPSDCDKKITKQLIKCGQLLGVEVIDHVIFCKNKKYYSFAEEGLVKKFRKENLDFVKSLTLFTRYGYLAINSVFWKPNNWHK